MPKFVLNGASPEVTIPHGLVVARAYLSSSGATAATPVVVTAVHSDGSLVPPPPVPPPPGTTVLAADQVDEVVLRAGMPGGYPPASQLTVTIEVGAHAVQVGPLPVGGLSMQTVATLSVATGQLRVRGSTGEMVDNIPMSAAAEAARAATSDVLGVSRVASLERFEAAVVLDGSASMSVETVRAAALTLVEVLAGIASVVAARPEVLIGVSGLPARGPVPVALGTTQEVVERQLEVTGLGSGARLGDSALYRGGAETNTVSWIVTDDVPRAREPLVVVNETPGAAVHLVVLRAGGRTESSEVDGIPVTAVSLDDIAALEGVPATRRALVESLLRGCFAPGTASFGKVRS